MTIVNQKQLGLRLKEARENANLTQYDLYKITNISTTQLSAYENGKKSIGLTTLAKIASALDVSIDELYFGSDSKKPITKSINTGELIVNCLVALYENKVVGMVPVENYDYSSPTYEIGFRNHKYNLQDLVEKLDDFEQNITNYPDPDSFKKQLLTMTSNKINSQIKK